MEFEKKSAAIEAAIERVLMIDGEPSEHLEFLRKAKSDENLARQFERLRNAIMPDMADESIVASLDGLTRLAVARTEGLESIRKVATDSASQRWLVLSAENVIERIRVGAQVK